MRRDLWRLSCGNVLSMRGQCSRQKRRFGRDAVGDCCRGCCANATIWPNKVTPRRNSSSGGATTWDEECPKITRKLRSGFVRRLSKVTLRCSTASGVCTAKAKACPRTIRKRQRGGSRRVSRAMQSHRPLSGLWVLSEFRVASILRFFSYLCGNDLDARRCSVRHFRAWLNRRSSTRSGGVGEFWNMLTTPIGFMSSLRLPEEGS
jgi:hypothetical protein